MSSMLPMSHSTDRSASKAKELELSSELARRRCGTLIFLKDQELTEFLRSKDCGELVETKRSWPASG